MKRVSILLVVIALFALALSQLSSAGEQPAPSGTITVASLSQTAQMTRVPRKNDAKPVCVQPPSACGANSDCSCSRCCSSWRVCQPTC